MVIKDKFWGVVDCDVVIEESAVDSYIRSAYSVTLDRELTEQQIEQLQKDYSGEIQVYSYENGSRNHN